MGTQAAARIGFTASYQSSRLKRGTGRRQKGLDIRTFGRGYVIDSRIKDCVLIDPCQGSGHILCYLFDTLIKIYEDYGYSARDAASKIVEYNIWGLDIDERASQLAYFSIMMKARQYDRRFFTRGMQPHIYAIQESNHIDPEAVKYFVNGNPNLKEAMDSIMTELYDAKEYGSILNVTPVDFDLLNQRIAECENEISLYKDLVQNQIAPLIHVAQTLSQKYHIVVTNPPYLGSTRFNDKLSQFIKDNYQDVKSDLSMVMYKHALDNMLKNNGLLSFITTSSWMVLSSFETLRNHVQSVASYSSLVDYGTELFDGKVGHNPIVSWVLRKNKINTKFTAIRLADYCYSKRNQKEVEFFNKMNLYFAEQSNFSKIPGSPIAYWSSNKLINDFKDGVCLKEICDTRKGLATSDNNRFLRLWYEVCYNKIGIGVKSNEDTFFNGKKWFPLNKGGAFRRWYGNRDYVINWENNGNEIRNFKDDKGKLLSRPQNTQYNFLQALTWTKITSSTFSARFCEGGFLFDDAAAICHHKDKELLKRILGFLNSSCCQVALKVLNLTLKIQIGDIGNLPILAVKGKNVEKIVDQCIDYCKFDWDVFETSWNFQKHPLICQKTTMARAFDDWQSECESRFNQLKSNEEELNRIFIDIYGLQNELTPEEEDKDITVRKADLGRDIRTFISYAVGCMFGRYSLDVDGLAYAGGDWDASKYKTFIPDKDDIIPITDDEYFTDDIVGRFVEFVKVVYGAETLEENLKFIADALGGKGTPREVIRDYFLNDFYKDHCKTYQKRPIYWLFDSGKKNGFKCLIYMHRYQPDTIARIRIDYVHEQQSRYRTAIEETDKRLQSAEGSNKVKLSKQLKKLRDQDEELHTYEEKIHHLADQMISIDLDDGVKHNYAIFQDVLAKIK